MLQTMIPVCGAGPVELRVRQVCADQEQQPSAVTVAGQSFLVQFGTLAAPITTNAHAARVRR
jgi:hypothetical protein